MTAINQPFVNADIMQRSVIMQLSAIGESHSSDWSGDQLRRHGGRTGWLAHQLAVLHMFFARTRKEGTAFWDPTYKSKHRLAHFEQLFRAMGSILNIPNPDELLKILSESSQNQVADYDWTMEALVAWAAEHAPFQKAAPAKTWTCQEMAMWAEDQEEFKENQVATNSRRLSRYIKSHASMVERLANIVEYTKIANKQVFVLRVPKK
jgi:hypothetical protein